MKKKYIIPIVVVLILVVGIASFIFYDNRTLSTITLDINPSIELKLDKNEKVRSVKALNSDAKDIISNDLKGKTLEDTLKVIVQNLIDKDYVSEKDSLDIILYSSNDLSNKTLEDKLNKTLEEKNIIHNIIVIENITKKDEELAKKYNISPAKASYINSILKDNENIKAENLVNKSANELNETKITGKYCDEDYILEGDFCLKEIERRSATNGKVCPLGYSEYEGECYEDTGILEKEDSLVCREEFTLKDGKCIRVETIPAEGNYSCTNGELIRKGDINPIGSEDNDKMYCIDKSTGIAPTLRCLTINHTMINGQCADGPKPTINGGCEAGDYLVNGGCYTMDNGDQWVCPSGSIYHKSQDSVPELCPDTLTYYEPTINGYSCPKGYNLQDKNCIRDEVEKPQKERYCKSGYTLVNNARCININKTANKEDGYLCNQDNSRLKGNVCVIYEIVEAKQ